MTTLTYKYLKIIFLFVLIACALIQILKTHLYIQDDNQRKILNKIDSDKKDQLVFSIEENVLINKKSAYKIKVIGDQRASTGKRLILSIDGKCDCNVGGIHMISSFDKIQTIDSYVANTKSKEFAITFLNPTAKYKRKGIFFVIHVSSSSISFIQNKEKGTVSVLTGIKNSFVLKVQTYIPFPYAELGHGLIISGKSALPKNIEDDFKRSGLMHIVVLSGFNVSIVIQFVFSIFAFGPKIFRFAVGTIFVILFVLMAGVSTALLRATLMALIALLCSLYKKEIDGLVLLGIVGLLLIIVDPLSFYFDLSFWLSILATFGLISLSGVIQDKLSHIPQFAGLREAGASSLATQIFVTPLLMLINPEVSILAFFANILILPIVPLTMALVFVTGVVGFISSFPAIFFGHVSYLLLGYIIFATNTVSQLPFATATFELNSFSPLFYYVFIIPLAIFVYKKKKP